MTPYQAHSETSKQAAQALLTKAQTVNKILLLFRQAGKVGLTGDDLEREFPTGVHRGTISARLIELERSGEIVKTTNKRLSRAKRYCAVYVLTQYANPNKVVPVKRLSGKGDNKALEEIAAIFFTMIKTNQLPSGDSKIHLTPFDITVLNNLAKRANIQGMKVQLGQLQQV